jgi:uncharacterized protein YjbJ (UPF0337 family)
MAQKTNITKDTPPEMIQSDIARTRQEMSGTVGEIQERLSPAHQATGKLRETARSTASRVSRTAREAASRIGDTARDTGMSVMTFVRTYPVPLAMIGSGVAWLMFTRTPAKEKTAERTAAIREKAGDLTGKTRERAEELSGQVREKASEFAGRAKESAQQFGRSARRKAWGAKSGLRQAIDSNPLGVGLAAFGIGALLGFSIPESRKEREIMGSASESLLTRAKESAQRTIQKAQHAAERAVETAGEEFRKTA